MKLIIGLGNPGKEYFNTRHNIGFMLIDKYLGNVQFKEKFNGLYHEYNSTNEKIIFLKPQTYMNNSGICIKKFIDYFNIDIKNIMVIHDDKDIKLGSYKFKFDSSSGGHNGVKSIIDNLNTSAFFRLKIGINTKGNLNTSEFVLGKFSKDELELINFEYLLEAIDDFINNDYSYVMNKYNRK